MPILVLLVQMIASQAGLIAPTAVVLGVTAAVSDDKAMEHYECQQRGECQ